MIWKQRWEMALILGLSCFVLGGCSIWESYSHPDYSFSRGERICHPYGDCSQGKWIPRGGSEMHSGEARLQCLEQGYVEYGNGWWQDSVSHGLEIGECMKKKGFELRQL
jgi:hypothetical protein